ncbi:unnamed protein product [Allacma fusca]|uniref:Uncharacterized protein n=1 Tax=Allacma fusca TaxID=39272 RepID=A0A8J2KBE2_9HEXA|nr:unnamed protein product [Allacma fusca]
MKRKGYGCLDFYNVGPVVSEMLREDEEEGNKFESFAKQLQCIQESQDVILADIRMDMEQLQMDNLALHQNNAKLLAEKNHWEELYHDMCRNAKIMREHIQNCNYSIPTEWSLPKSSSRTVQIHQPMNSAHRSKDPDYATQRVSRHDSQEKSSSLKTEGLVRRRSRSRMSTSSQASLGESTASEETQCGGRSSAHHNSSRSKSPSRNTSTPKKHKSKHGCFGFLRKKSQRDRSE